MEFSNALFQHFPSLKALVTEPKADRICCALVLIGLSTFGLYEIGLKFSGFLEMWLYPCHDAIFVDSGACQYVCPHRERLSNYKPYPVVRAPGFNGSTTEQYGSGDYEMRVVRSDGSTEAITLKDVHFCPDAVATQVSTQALRREGIFYSSETQCLYRRKQERLIEVATVTPHNSPVYGGAFRLPELHLAPDCKGRQATQQACLPRFRDILRKYLVARRERVREEYED